MDKSGDFYKLTRYTIYLRVGRKFMEPSLFEDSTREDTSLGVMLLDSCRYWNKKRLPFNVIVGLAGFTCVIYFSKTALTLFDLIGMVAGGIVSNTLYSIG